MWIPLTRRGRLCEPLAKRPSKGTNDADAAATAFGLEGFLLLAALGVIEISVSDLDPNLATREARSLIQRKWGFGRCGTIDLMAHENELLAAGRARMETWRAALARQAHAPVALVETHISWVLLDGPRAYKIKKPVRYAFADFTTLDKRRRDCDEELRLNRRFAPAIYIDVADLRESRSGYDFEGDGRVVEVVLRMHRFPDGALWSERLEQGTLAPHHIDVMATRLAAFHRDAPIAGQADAPAQIASPRRTVVTRLIAGIDSWVQAQPSAADGWPVLRSWVMQQLDELAAFSDLRLRNGKVRECHGDLHLANVVQLGEEPTPFDALEFDLALRCIDVLDDLAFLVMDLLVQGRRDYSFRLLCAYLDATGDHEGMPCLRFFIVVRALVRAQALALSEENRAVGRVRARDYLAFACRFAAGVDPRIAITHGLPGSGKTFASQALLEAAKAVRIRSDVERKRLAGLSSSDSTRGRGLDVYDAASNERTYARLDEIAAVVAAAGWRVIVDAAFLDYAQRERFARTAQRLKIPFFIIDCSAPIPVLRDRVARRVAVGQDASEADLDVLDRLATRFEPLTDCEKTKAVVIDPRWPLAPAAVALRWLEAR